MARDDTDAPPPSSPWSLGLSPKIAAAVLRRLPSHVDRVCFAAVCRAWRAATKHHHHPRSPPLPWLALPDGTFFSFPSSGSLRFHVAAAGYHGSCDDWLLFNGDDGDGGGDGFLLLNPFSGDTVRLPGLSRVRFVVGDGALPLPWRGITDDWRAPFGTTVRKLAMSPGGEVVAAMVGDGRLGKIALCRCRAGAGSSWVMSGHDAWRGITDIAFYDGTVYAVEDTGDLLAMPTGEDSRRAGEPTVAWAKCVIKARPHAAPAAARRRKQAPPPTTRRYLLVSGGKLMMVHRAVSAGDGATKFAVYKADLVASRWSEVRSVGDDTALFVGRWCSLARRVSAYGLPGNRIHFLDDDDGRFSRGCAGSRFGSYDMGDGKTYPLLPPPPVELRNGDTPATWLFPSEQEVLRWCDLPCDVLGLVLSRLSSREERARLGEVSRDWRASAQQHRSSIIV